MGLFVNYIQKPLDSLAVNLLTTITGQNTTLSYWCHEWWEQGVDSRTKGYSMVDISAASISAVLLLYILVVVYIIPKRMENREPMSLKTIMIIYDFTMVIIYAL